MDCIGYNQEMKEMVVKGTNKPVILARTLVARVLGEILNEKTMILIECDFIIFIKQLINVNICFMTIETVKRLMKNEFFIKIIFQVQIIAKN